MISILIILSTYDFGVSFGSPQNPEQRTKIKEPTQQFNPGDGYAAPDHGVRAREMEEICLALRLFQR